jgi:hypothetical protein
VRKTVPLLQSANTLAFHSGGLRSATTTGYYLTALQAEFSRQPIFDEIVKIHIQIVCVEHASHFVAGLACHIALVISTRQRPKKKHNRNTHEL